MRAFVLTGHGGPEKLVLEPAWPVPRLGAGEALIEVSACGVNNTDVNTRVGWYSLRARDGAEGGRAADAGARAAPRIGDGGAGADGGWLAALEFPRIQGADVCGRVVAVAPGVSESLLGRRVLVDPWLRDWDAPLKLEGCVYLGSEHDGGFAEYLSVPARNVHPIESALSDVELASFATASLTAMNMLDRVGVTEGESVLVTGASGGVGSALVQLARERGAATPQCALLRSSSVCSRSARAPWSTAARRSFRPP